MVAVIVVVVVVAAAVTIALMVGKHTKADAPTQPAQYVVPAQLDRDDFSRPQAPWLVVVFTSRSCSSCANTVEKAFALRSGDVFVQEIEFSEHRSLHDRYEVEAVPMVLVADAKGIVRASFIGSPSAADLWTTVAKLREDGPRP
jgi:thioredoxin-like negative regulator of GroEL